MSDRPGPVVITLAHDELALLVEALIDASFFRDARGRALRGAVKRSARRSGLDAVASAQSGSAAEDQRKSRAYEALAAKLRLKL